MKITREIKTAILVIASILLFIWGYVFLKGRDLLHNYRTFYVEYVNVEGLSKSAPVTISGLVVGKVSSITLQKASGNLIVELQISNDFPISKSSMVNIYEPGLIGGKQIQIIPNYKDPVLAETGDHLKGGVIASLTDIVAERLTPLQLKVEKMIVSADSVLSNLNTVLDAKTKNSLKRSIQNLDETLAQFNSASKSINSILTDNKSKINTTMTNLNKASTNIAVLSDTLAKAKIGKIVRNLENTLSKVNGIISDVYSGKGSMGKLMKDDALYTNLNKSSKELELLLQDVRLNPTRYINVSLFGKKNKPYIAPVIDSLKQVNN